MRSSLRATIRGLIVSAALGGSFTCTALASAAELDESVAFDIRPQSLESALLELSKQSSYQIVFAPGAVPNHIVPALNGTMQVRDALDRLLDGTQLDYRLVGKRTITVGPGEPRSKKEGRITVRDSANPRSRDLALATRLAQANSDSPQAANQKEAAAASFDEVPRQEQARLEEIVVTGTQIRGSEPVGAAMITMDRAEIARTGAATVQDLITVLPQNFGGDASEDVYATAAGPRNSTGGTGVNLRGLGSSATLVLVNGRRLPQVGGVSGSYVDVSNIPLSAIERVEVLTDGASAIYGSDAVAGVINFVLRRDFEGSETQARYGTVTSGGLRESQFSHVIGRSWGGGSAVLDLDYYDRGNLRGYERPYWGIGDLRRYGGDDFRSNYGNPANIIAPIKAAIPAGRDGASLTPEDLLLGQENMSSMLEHSEIVFAQERVSAYLTAQQDLSDSIELSADVFEPPPISWTPS